MSPKGRLRAKRRFVQDLLEANRRLKQRWLRNDPIVTLRRWIGKPCPYCDDIMTDGMASMKRPTKDHLVPKRLRQHPEDKYRFVICCRECNDLKGEMQLEEFLRWNYWHRQRKAKANAILNRGRVGSTNDQEHIAVHCYSSL